MDQKKATPIIVALLLPALLFGLVFGIVLLGSNQDRCAPGAPTPGVSVDPASVPDTAIAGYGHDQLVNAAYIMQAGKALGLSARDQTIGVMTAMGESSLRVINYGDGAGPDSRGLFQQRDNGAWGSYTDRMDPFVSATNFFRVLASIVDRDTLTPTAAAHRVQRNADPNHYARYWEAALQIVEGLSGVQGTGAGERPVTSQYPLGNVKPQTAIVANQVGPMFNIKTVGGYRESARDPNGHPSGLALDFMINDIPDGTATGDRLAQYLIDHAQELGVDYLIWKQRSWSTARVTEGWRNMEDRGSPTQNHFDHVHLNLKADAVIKTTTATCEPTKSAAATNDAGWTIPGTGPIGSPFGMRFHPIDHVWRLHGGVDLHAGGCDGPIWAAHDGVVIRKGFDSRGNGIITVDHGGGVTTSYLHMYSAGMLVEVGDQVTAGQQIAKTGSSGQSTGCHLHFAVKVNGELVDPETFLSSVGITLG